MLRSIYQYAEVVLYEIYKREAARVYFPAVSITPGRKLVLNAAAVRKFREGAVQYVLLLWDRARRKIAIRVISKPDIRSFKVSYSKHGAAISGASFLRFIGWRETKRVTFPAVWDEEQRMLEFSLKR